MKLSKIHSVIGFNELFSFIEKELKFNIIKYNNFFNKKLNVIYNIKRNFCEEKIKYYEFNNVNEYFIQFQNDLQNIIKKEEINELFFYGLSKKENFYLTLTDEYFNLLIDNNPYFEQNLNIKIDDFTKELLLPRFLLIKENKLTEKALTMFKEIFDLYSINGKISKIKLFELMNKAFNGDINYQLISNIFSSYFNDKYLNLEGFYQFYFDLLSGNKKSEKIIGYLSNINIGYFSNLKKEYFQLSNELKHERILDIVWNNLNNFGYKSINEKIKEYDLNYLQTHYEEFEQCNKLNNFLKLYNKKIYKLSLGLNVDKIFFKILAEKEFFKYIKVIIISVSHFHKFIKSNIKLINLEELHFYINETLKYNINEINNIFPNINSLNLFIIQNIDLIDLFRYIQQSKIMNLGIYFSLFRKYNNSKSEIIILDNIINLKIYINKNNCFINELFMELFNNFQFPNLKSYILSFNINKFGVNEINRGNLKIDYNFVNNFIIDISKKKFSFQSFFNLLNKLTNINFLHLSEGHFDFIYKSKNKGKYLFKFNIDNEKKFKEYYLNYNLSIDNNEIIKYEKIDIKGLNKINNDLNKVEEIIEDNKINICDINLSIGLKKYLIKSFKNVESIYCEDEIQKTNLKELINQKELNTLKYINITIGYIKELYKDIYFSYNHIYKYLFELIKNSQNLKSLVLRIQSNNYIEDIYFIFSLIEDLKKLRKVNIQILSNTRFKISLEILFNKFPKLKNRIYYFEELKINNVGFERKINNIEINKKYINSFIGIYNIGKINKKVKILNKQINENENNYILYLNNKKKKFRFIYEFQQIGKYEIKIRLKNILNDMNNMFSGCSSLISLNLSNFNTDNVTNMSYMSYECSSLISLNLSNFNTYNVTNMSYMFYGCSSLISLNLSNFNTDNVTNMSYMFYKCTSLISLNLSNFNTDNVTNMSYMFYKCTSLISLNLSNFNTDNVRYLNDMFYNCYSLTSLNLSNFNTYNVNDMRNMFYNCYSLISLNLSNFNIDYVRYLNGMFYNCYSLTSLNLSNFNVNVTKISLMLIELSDDCIIIYNDKYFKKKVFLNFF